MQLSRLFFIHCLCIGATLAAAPLLASAQGGVGARFGGAREPRSCADYTAPTRGAITSALAAKYVICDVEAEHMTSLLLVDNVRVQVGATRPFQALTDSYTDIDHAAPVYPIRGSFVEYSCSEPNAAVGTVGKNCTVYDQPHAQGVCYKTSFGDWRCRMADLDNSLTVLRRGVAPPR